MWAVLTLLLLSVSLDVRGATGRSPRVDVGTGRRDGNVFRPPAGRDSAAMDAVFVASRADCSGNLLLSNILASRGVQAVLGTPELVLQGSPRDTIGLRGLLPFALRKSPIRLLSDGEKRFLHAIGHHATPVLLVFDRERRLRVASQVDPDPVARVALARAVRHLVTLDPSP